MSKQNLPKDYFKNLQSKIVQDAFDIDDNLKINAPILSQIKKANIYKVPSEYFSNSAKELLKQTNPKVRFLTKKTIGIAASFLVMISISWAAFNNTNSEIELTAEVDDASLIDYYLENTDELDNEILAELNDDTHVEEEIDLEEISNEELNEYIETIVDDVSISDLEIINI